MGSRNYTDQVVAIRAMFKMADSCHYMMQPRCWYYYKYCSYCNNYYFN